MVPSSKKDILSWCLYDWANSAFSTVILTFVFSVYFTKGIAINETTGSAEWSYAVGFAGLCVAVLSPLFGVMLDFKGGHMKWLSSLTVITAFCIAVLFFMKPEPYFVLPSLLTVIIAIIAFELAQVVYNAMLPSISQREKIGRVSGWAWALGYVGGLACLAVALFFFVGMGKHTGLLGISKEESLNVRATALLTAIWFVLFSLPLLLNKFLDRATQEKPQERVTTSLITGIVMTLFSELKALKNIIRFLIASALYRDGLATLFIVGGVYAAGTFHMGFSEILLFGIGLNVTAGLGAFIFSFMDDLRGSKTVVMISLAALILCGLVIVFIHDKTLFMGIALFLGVFVGPVQAASRTLLARITPPEKITEMYGLYALTGRSIAFLGPLSFGLLTDIFDSQRAGLSTIILFWILGFVLMLKVREDSPETAGFSEKASWEETPKL